MSITPKDLIDYARTVHRNGTQEVEHRTSVGRAYYAAYHGCKAWHDKLPAKGAQTTGVGVHAQLIHAMRNPSPSCSPQQQQASKAAAVRLSALKIKRAAADYELTSRMGRVEAENACIEAAQILAQL